MADLNALIAQGVQFKAPPDPFAQYAQMQQLQQGEQTNQMNQALMQEKQRGFQEMNALRGVMSRPGFDLSTPESQREVYSVAPTLAENIIRGHMGTQKTAAEIKNLGYTGQETQAKLALEKQKHLGQMYRDISSRPSDANITAHAEDVEASPLYTPEEKATVRAKAERLLSMPMADRMTMLSEQGATAGELRPQPVAAGGSLMRGGTVIGTAPEKTPPPPAMVGEYNFAKTPEGGGFRGTYQDFVTARATAGRAPRPEAALRTQQVTMNDGTLGIINMDTGAVTPATLSGAPVKGKPSALAEKTKLQQQQLTQNLGVVIGELKDAVKEGGLIDQSTGSGAGRLTDVTAGFFGKATPGAIAIGKLQPIADLALKMVPRFEGPQSDKDTASYKQAAGQLADATLPTAIRKEAAKTVIRLMENRKSQFMSSDMAAEGAAPTAAAGQNALSSAEQAELDQLRKRFGGK